MEIVTIHATSREGTGKGVARKLRAGGMFPAVAYGQGGAAIHLSLDPKEVQDLRTTSLGWNQPVLIEVEGGDSIPLAMLREVQKHPISGALLHADFLVMQEGTPVQVRIPVRTQGRAIGEETGGVLSQPVRVIRVTCLPKSIPEEVIVDITALTIGDKVSVGDLELPPGVTVDTDHARAVLSVVGRMAEVEELDEEGEEGEEGEAGEEGEEGADGAQGTGDAAGGSSEGGN